MIIEIKNDPDAITYNGLLFSSLKDSAEDEEERNHLEEVEKSLKEIIIITRKDCAADYESAVLKHFTNLLEDNGETFDLIEHAIYCTNNN